MIYSRANMIDGKQSQLWAIAERQYGGAILLAAVDGVYGSKDEHKAWMLEVGIKSKHHHALNTMIHFFAKEEDAAMFYLRWDKP